MHYFKFHHEVMSDSKVQTLDPEIFRAWVNILCMASAHKPRGYLPPMKQVAYILHVREDEAKRIVAELMEAGLVDSIEGQLRPHNWDVRQGRVDLSTERSRRHRQKTKAKLKAVETVSPAPAPPPVEVAPEPMQRVANRDATNVGTVANGEQEKRLDERRGEEMESPSNDVDSGGGGAVKHDDDDDEDARETDRAYVESAMRTGYQIISRGHRATIEHTRALFGDPQAVAVGHNGMRIHQALGGGWHFFRAAAETLKRSGKSKYDYVGAVLVNAKDYRSTGIPPAPVPVAGASAPAQFGVFPRVPAFLAEREKTSAAMRAYVPKAPRDATP